MWHGTDHVSYLQDKVRYDCIFLRCHFQSPDRFRRYTSHSIFADRSHYPCHRAERVSIFRIWALPRKLSALWFCIHREATCRFSQCMLFHPWYRYICRLSGIWGLSTDSLLAHDQRRGRSLWFWAGSRKCTRLYRAQHSPCRRHTVGACRHSTGRRMLEARQVLRARAGRDLTLFSWEDEDEDETQGTPWKIWNAMVFR